jgi:uncharacterized protein (TIGR03086 family)
VTPLGAGIALLRRSSDYLLESLSGVTASDLDRPTPCPDWDLRRLILHVADSADGLAELVTTGSLNFPDPPRGDAEEPVAVARDRVARLLATVNSATPSGEQAGWARSAAAAGAIEFAAHGWDIAAACGTRPQIPSELGTELLELATPLISDADRRPQFGPRVDVSPAATPSDQYVAFLGRHPMAEMATRS